LSTYAKAYADEPEQVSSSSFSFTYEMSEISEPPPCFSPVRIAGATPVYYSSLQFAYDNAANGDIIQSQAEVFYEDLYIGINKSITFEGGYDCYYSTIAGETALNGNLTINNGTATIENFVVE
jgi:hypothetical protein